MGKETSAGKGLDGRTDVQVRGLPSLRSNGGRAGGDLLGWRCPQKCQDQQAEGQVAEPLPAQALSFSLVFPFLNYLSSR